MQLNILQTKLFSYFQNRTYEPKTWRKQKNVNEASHKVEVIGCYLPTTETGREIALNLATIRPSLVSESSCFVCPQINHLGNELLVFFSLVWFGLV